MPELEETRYVNEKKVAEITGRAVKTLRNDRSQKRGIPYVKIGSSVRYDINDIHAFMQKHKILTFDV